MSVTVRRTAPLTRQAREMFERVLDAEGGWTPGETLAWIGDQLGLNVEQMRDAIFGESADEWRRALQERVGHRLVYTR